MRGCRPPDPSGSRSQRFYCEGLDLVGHILEVRAPAAAGERCGGPHPASLEEEIANGESAPVGSPVPEIRFAVARRHDLGEGCQRERTRHAHTRARTPAHAPRERQRSRQRTRHERTPRAHERARAHTPRAPALTPRAHERTRARQRTRERIRHERTRARERQRSRHERTRQRTRHARAPATKLFLGTWTLSWAVEGWGLPSRGSDVLPLGGAERTTVGGTAASGKADTANHQSRDVQTPGERVRSRRTSRTAAVWPLRSDVPALICQKLIVFVQE